MWGAKFRPGQQHVEQDWVFHCGNCGHCSATNGNKVEFLLEVVKWVVVTVSIRSQITECFSCFHCPIDGHINQHQHSVKLLENVKITFGNWTFMDNIFGGHLYNGQLWWLIWLKLHQECKCKMVAQKTHSSHHYMVAHNYVSKSICFLCTNHWANCSVRCWSVRRVKGRPNKYLSNFSTATYAPALLSPLWSNCIRHGECMASAWNRHFFAALYLCLPKCSESHIWRIHVHS